MFPLLIEWHLTPHMTLSIETCIRRTPCIKRTLQHSPRVSLNTGFTVLCSFCFMYLSHLRDFLNAYPSLMYTLLLATRLASSSLTKPL